MDGGQVVGAASRPGADGEHPNQPEPHPAGGLHLTSGQRLLAGATAAAVLASGVNALAQLARLLIGWWQLGRF